VLAQAALFESGMHRPARRWRRNVWCVPFRPPPRSLPGRGFYFSLETINVRDTILMLMSVGIIYLCFYMSRE